MKRNMNGRKRPLFDEELTAQMRAAAPEAGGHNARAGSAPRRKPSGDHSAAGDAGGRISVISAILTGRRSRSVACVVVAAVVALSAVVSVAASIVASHISSDTENVQMLNAAEDGERSTLSGDRSLDPAQNGTADKAGTPPAASGESGDSGDSGSSGDSGEAVSGVEPDDTEVSPDAAQVASSPETDANTDDAQSADTADEAGAQPGDGAATAKHTVRISFWDRDSLVVETDAATLGDAIALSGVSLSEAQLANLDLTAPIEADMTVNADVVTYDTEDVEETIPFETEYRQSAELAAGVTEVTQQGVEGNQTRRFTVTYVNGAEVSRVQTASWVDSYVRNQIITTGTGQSVSAAAPPSPSPSAASPDSAGGGTIVGADGVTYSYSSVMDVKATFYYAGGTTAYGLPADENVIGVDPSVIPFGTRVYVVGPYGDFGVRIAADCGNMYGNRIDICLNRDNPLAAGFGWRDMKVYILN